MIMIKRNKHSGHFEAINAYGDVIMSDLYCKVIWSCVKTYHEEMREYNSNKGRCTLCLTGNDILYLNQI